MHLTNPESDRPLGNTRLGAVTLNSELHQAVSSKLIYHCGDPEPHLIFPLSSLIVERTTA